MTVSQWIAKEGKHYRWCELTICNKERHIILDDRLAYLDSRSKDYNDSWRKKCRGKQIVSVENGRKGIILVVD